MFENCSVTCSSMKDSNMTTCLTGKCCAMCGMIQIVHLRPRLKFREMLIIIISHGIHVHVRLRRGCLMLSDNDMWPVDRRMVVEQYLIQYMSRTNHDTSPIRVFTYSSLNLTKLPNASQT